MGTPPLTYVLDNEISKDLTNGLDSERMAHQFVVPCKHKNNQAERAMQTFKAHFKSALAAVDSNFPISEWDRLIPQANIIINLSTRCS